MSMVREAIFFGINQKQYEQSLLLSKKDWVTFLENSERELVNLGFSENFNESSMMDQILKKLKSIKDELKLNRIYTFLFKDELINDVRVVLNDKGIVSNNDVEMITSWIITTDATLAEKRDFILQISKHATDPIIHLSSKGDFKKYSGSVLQLESLINNSHPVLGQILDKCIDWTPGGSQGGGAASAGPGEGMLKLLSYNTVPISKGDVQLGKFTLEVKGNVKGNDGGALAGGKGAKGWKSVDAQSLIEKEFGVSLGKVDLRLINKTLDKDWKTVIETIMRTNGGKEDEIFRKCVLKLSSEYFSQSSKHKSYTNFKDNLEQVSFSNMKNSSEKNHFFRIFCLYNLEYYREMEHFDYVFLVQYSERKFAIIKDGVDFLKLGDALRIKYGDFKWDVAPGAFRLGLH